MDTIFGNPGSTEITLLAGLPDDLRFVLALHEASVVGMATGWALGRRCPALVVLHTTAGLGNAVGALATARVNRAPLVVLVGQQAQGQPSADLLSAGGAGPALVPPGRRHHGAGPRSRHVACHHLPLCGRAILVSNVFAVPRRAHHSGQEL